MLSREEKEKEEEARTESSLTTWAEIVW